jgi:hypothetical protein
MSGLPKPPACSISQYRSAASITLNPVSMLSPAGMGFAFSWLDAHLPPPA